MIGAATRYRELVAELLLLRALNEGELPLAEEVRFAAALDNCWTMMDELEQAQVERTTAAALHPIGAPVDLH